MAKDDKNALEGFTMLSDMLTPGAGDTSSSSDVEIPEVDPEDILNQDDETDENDYNDQNRNTNDNEDNDQNVEDLDENEDEDENIDENEKDKESVDSEQQTEEDDENIDEPLDLSEFESDISLFLKDKLVEEAGIDFPEDLEIKSVGDVINYLDELVSEASKPIYANEDVGKLDEYVRNGGDLKKFYSEVYEKQFNLDNFNLESESDQKKILKEQLKTQGLSDDLIKRKIERWEESGVLEEEAADALDWIKQDLSKKEEKLLEDQKKQRENMEDQQRQFVENVEASISNMKDIRGIPITKKEKQELVNYLLKPTKSGRTQYQEDFSSDPNKFINNLIESAYFTKHGDSFIKKAKDQASSSTYKDLQNKLKNKKNKRVVSNSSGDNLAGNTKLGLGTLSKALIG